MIELNKLQVNYPDFSLDYSLKIADGTIAGLIGKNGSGKTTTFRAILDLVAPDAGTITLTSGGQPVPANTLGVVLSNSFFNDMFTASDIARMGEKFYPDFAINYFWDKCQLLDLPPKKQLKEFSTGMKAKIKTIFALSHQAKILLLDEPTSGLDVMARTQILTMVQEYLVENPTTSVLISSHISSDLEKICDEIFYIDAGKLVLHEDTDTLLDEYAIVKVHGEDFDTVDTQYVTYIRKMSYGFDLLTDERKFYQENYPNLVIEIPTIDDIVLLMMEGKKK